MALNRTTDILLKKLTDAINTMDLAVDTITVNTSDLETILSTGTGAKAAGGASSRPLGTVEGVQSENGNIAAAGYPVHVGGRYDATPRTLSDERVGAIALNASGHVIVENTAMSTDLAALEVLSTAANVDLAALEVLTTAANVSVAAVASAIQTEDLPASTGDKGMLVFAVRDDAGSCAAQDGDYVALQVDHDGYMYVKDHATQTDNAAFTLGSDKGTMMMGFAGTQSVNANDAGALAMDTDGALHVSDGGNSLTVDGTVTANLSATDNAVLDTIDAVLDTIKVDTNAMKVDLAAIEVLSTAANVDLAALEVLSTAANVDHAANEVLLTTLASSIKAEDAAHVSGDKGIMAFAVRKDVADCLAQDGDYQPMQTDVIGAVRTQNTFGTWGTILVNDTTLTECDVSGRDFVAIYMLTNTVFASGAGGLSSATDQLYLDDTFTGTDIDSNGGGTAIDGITFPAGMTLYGRYTGFTLASGSVIAYVG